MRKHPKNELFQLFDFFSQKKKTTLSAVQKRDKNRRGYEWFSFKMCHSEPVDPDPDPDPKVFGKCWIWMRIRI
jgi:hypothetical protein